MGHEFIFVSATKIGKNTSSILNCYFSNLHFGISKKLPRVKYTTMFLRCLKIINSQTFNSSNIKNLLASIYVIETTFFDKCFLFHVITGRHWILQKFIVIKRFFSTVMLLPLRKNEVFH